MEKLKKVFFYSSLIFFTIPTLAALMLMESSAHDMKRRAIQNHLAGIKSNPIHRSTHNGL